MKTAPRITEVLTRDLHTAIRARLDDRGVFVRLRFDNDLRAPGVVYYRGSVHGAHGAFLTGINEGVDVGDFPTTEAQVEAIVVAVVEGVDRARDEMGHVVIGVTR